MLWALLLLSTAGAEGDFVVIRGAEKLEFDRRSRLVAAEGRIEASYKGWTLSGRRLKANLREDWAELEGEVSVGRRGLAARGERVTVDFAAKRWRVEGAFLTLSPEFFKGRAAEPVYLYGESVEGGEDFAHIVEGGLTTCNYVLKGRKPHWAVKARSIEVQAGKRLVLRGAGLSLFGRRILTLPTLTIPLRRPAAGERAGRRLSLPEIGSNRWEGFYVKHSYDYLVSPKSGGTLFAQYTEKHGLKLGADHRYSASGGGGEVHFSYLRDRRWGTSNISARASHRQTLPFGGRLSLRGDLTRNSYYYGPGTTTLDAAAELTLKGHSLAARWRRTAGLWERTERRVNLRGGWGRKTRLRYNLTYEAFSRPRQPTDLELNASLDLERRAGKTTYALSARKRVDLDEDEYTGDRFFYFTEKLPELRVARPVGLLGLKGLRTNAELLLGRYVEYPGGTDLERVFFSLDTSGRARLTERADLDLFARFEQGYYSNRTAQWALRLNGRLSLDLGSGTALSLNYRMQHPEGFTPFRFDYRSKYHTLDIRLERRIPRGGRGLSFLAYTGYDFRRHYKQDLTLRLEYRGRTTRAYLWTGYNFERGKPRDLTLRWWVDKGERLRAQLGLRYGLERGRLFNLRAIWDWKAHRFWRLQGAIGWNGYTRRFDFRQFAIERDLHCFVLRLFYAAETREFKIDLYLKAFPLFKPRFGLSPYGQVLDASMGTWY